MKQLRYTGSFVAKDASGRRQTLLIYTEYHRADTFAGSETVEGLKKLRTKDGNHVNRVDKGKYHVVQTGEDLTSDDPNAP